MTKLVNIAVTFLLGQFLISQYEKNKIIKGPDFIGEMSLKLCELESRTRELEEFVEKTLGYDPGRVEEDILRRHQGHQKELDSRRGGTQRHKA